MTQDFVMGQLRLALVAALAFAGGKGWITPADAGFATAMMTSLGPLFAPWLWSIFVNINRKSVPKNSVAVSVTDVNDANNPGLQRLVPVEVGSFVKLPEAVKVVGALLIGFILLAPQSSYAQSLTNPLGLNTITNSPLLKALSQWGADDIAAAEALSSSIPNLSDDVGKACWQQFAAMGAIVKQHPLPLTFKLASDIEAGRLFLMALKNVCKNPQCTQVFADLSNQVGAFSPIPVGLSFTSICAKIP